MTKEIPSVNLRLNDRGNLYDVVGTYQQIEDKFVERFLEEK